MQQKKTREKSKTRAWEKDRRKRLNDGFTKLSQVLPTYDFSKNFSKLEILENAKLAITDLDEKLKAFLYPQDSKKCDEEKLKVFSDVIKRLQTRIRKLLVRNEQLSNLLKNAGITVPREYSAVKKFTKSYKDIYKASQQRKKDGETELEKENQVKVKPKKAKPYLDLKRKKSCSPSVKNKRFSKKKQASKIASSFPNCVFIVSQPNLINSSCYILARNARKGNQTVITNSSLLKSPIVSPNIKPSVFSGNVATNLGSGTLILTNGTVTPIVQTPQILPVVPTIFNPIQSNVSTLIVVSCNAKSSCTNKITSSTSLIQSSKSNKIQELKYSSEDIISSNMCPILRPKICQTKTTQVNKVPIPALSSKNKHLCINTTKISKTDISQEKNLDNCVKNIKNISNKRKRCNIDDNSKTKKRKPNIEQKQFSAESSVCNKDSIDVKSTLDNTKVNPPVHENSKDNCESIKTNVESCIKPKLQVSVSEIATVVNTSSSNQSFNTLLEQSDIVQNSKSENKSEISKDIESKKEKPQLHENKTKLNDQPVSTMAVCTNSGSELTSDLIFSTSSSKPECNLQELKSMSYNLSRTVTSSKDINDTPDIKSLELNLPQSELSNDIFASLQVPSGCQNPESTSPTAAFLLAFPLVSSGVKVTEVINDENNESQTATPNILQIGTMETTKPSQSHSESLTPSLLNLDGFSFFSNKDSCSGFYNNYTASSNSQICSTTTTATISNQNYVNSRALTEMDNKANLMVKGQKNNGIRSCQNNYNNIPVRSTASIDTKHTNPQMLHKKMNKEHKLSNPSHCSITNNVDRPASGVQSNSCQSRSIGNTHFPKGGSNEPYVPKSFESCSNYSGYKDCSSLASNSFYPSKNFNPAYTIAGSNNYFYNSYSSENENRNYNTSQCSEYRKRDNYLNHYNNQSQIYNKEKYVPHVPAEAKVPHVSQNKPINWMTTPSTTSSYKTDYFLPPFTKDNDFTSNLNTSNSFNTISSNAYFPSSSMYTPSEHLNSDTRKGVDISFPTYNSYQRPDNEENQFSWSPNKMPQFLDPTHSFVSSTLPTLVGDLALNNFSTVEQKSIIKDRSNKDSRRKIGNFDAQTGQSNFLSVSQLVERESVPGKVSSRRNSGNRSKVNTSKKRLENKVESSKELQSYHKIEKNNQSKNFVNDNLFCDPKHQNRNNKMIPSNYSAEALIGNHINGGDNGKKVTPFQNKGIVPNFLGDNIGPYFPAVEVPPDNSYMQANQGYQSNSFTHNFSSFQNNSYGSGNIIPSACAITSSYLPNNNFMHNSNGQEYQADNSNVFQNIIAAPKDKVNCTKNYNRSSDKDDKHDGGSCKKSKKRNLNEGSLPSFDINFLSFSASMNSPILPDVFDTTYLPPTTLYSCKNPLYSKPDLAPGTLIPPLPAPGKHGIQHPEISPSVNSMGTSLTNFNMSTIFPEINKGPIQEHYTDNRNKDYSVGRNFPATSSIQVPFSSKPSISFSSFGT